METNEMTPEKSLKIISEAIARSRRDFEKNAGTPMILWGAVVLIFSMAVWIMLKQTDNQSWNYLWFGIPAVGCLLQAVFIKDFSLKSGNTFLGKTLAQVWIMFGIFATAIALVFTLADAAGLIGLTVIVLIGFAASITGLALKNNLITVCGVLTGIGCPAAMLFAGNYDSSLFLAASSVLNLIVPGMAMNRKADQVKCCK